MARTAEVFGIGGCCPGLGFFTGGTSWILANLGWPWLGLFTHLRFSRLPSNISIDWLSFIWLLCSSRNSSWIYAYLFKWQWLMARANKSKTLRSFHACFCITSVKTMLPNSTRHDRTRPEQQGTRKLHGKIPGCKKYEQLELLMH